MPHNTSLRGVSASALLLSLLSSSSLAQEALPIIDIDSSSTPAARPAPAAPGETRATAPKPFEQTLPDNIPATVETVTAKQISEQINAVTAAEVVKYLPSIDIRERFYGDQNPMIGFRTVTQDTPAQSLIYADGILLSNLLGNYYEFPPVFQMVSPKEITRVDVMYGPFSALYAGNSYGGVLTMTTRMPEKFEFHASVGGLDQRFDLYSTGGWYPGYHTDVAVGDKINDFSYWLSFNHLTSNSQPLQFNPSAASVGSYGRYPVVGGVPILDYQGTPSYISGAFASYTVEQETYRMKLAYDFSPTTRLTYTAAMWSFSQNSGAQTYLTGANGLPLYNVPASGGPYGGPYWGVTTGGLNYYPWGLDPNHQTELQLSQGLELKSDSKGVFDYDAVVSANNMLSNGVQSANDYTVNSSGLNTRLTGTNWVASDLRFIWRPTQQLAGKHEVSFGGHLDQYVLNENVDNMPIWPSFGGTSPDFASYGKTQTKALYLQDVWAFQPDWKLTVGGREEFWDAFDGQLTAWPGNSVPSATPTPPGVTSYQARSQQHFSPKASLAWQATPDFLVRASYGNAMRFPTVTELYQLASNSAGVNLPNPLLSPEQVDSYELTGEYRFGKNTARVSFFHEDRWNEIYGQINELVYPNVTSYSNVGKTRFNGIESAVDLKDVGIERFDLNANLTFTGTDIESNFTDPSSVGKNYPGIAKWRGKLTGVYRPTETLSLAAGVRYSSNPYALLDNSDWNHDVFGARSGYLLFDAKVNYKFEKNWTLSAGVDNIGSYKYYDYHPFAQRTFFAELRYDFGGPGTSSGDSGVVPGSQRR